MKSIGGKISSLRKSIGLTQEQFANEIGVSKPSLVKFEKGETEIIPLGVAIKIAKTLSENFGQLFEIEGCQFASAQQDALISTLQDSEAYLETKVKELQEVIQKNEQLIKLLQKENKELFKAKAGLELKENFGLYHETENKIRETKDEKETEKLRAYQKRVNGYFISKKISEIFDSGLLSRFEVLELIFENDIMVPEMYAIKEDLLESFTHHLNQFFEIGIEEVSTFLEKYEAKASRSG